MAHLNPEKPHVNFYGGANADGPIKPRAYTLSNCSILIIIIKRLMNDRLNAQLIEKEYKMPNYKNGPIEFYSFGKFIIDGKEHSEVNDKVKGQGKDIMLVGKGVSEWKEREGHRLSIDMVTRVFDEDIDILIIGAGADKALKCPKKVISKIRKRGISRVIVIRTPKACKVYNRQYIKGKKVALLAHGTC